MIAPTVETQVLRQYGILRWSCEEHCLQSVWWFSPSRPSSLRAASRSRVVRSFLGYRESLQRLHGSFGMGTLLLSVCPGQASLRLFEWKALHSHLFNPTPATNTTSHRSEKRARDRSKRLRRVRNHSASWPTAITGRAMLCIAG